ncbi:helix-turn-helix domain-containing protein [Paenibacillus popilliae]|uniref:AraC family transcriptional regulator n=1 Tax=Paenibacillus popilliae TaxID=78057 RepID=A0ABY3AJK1_PAEPP|nr:AraC family transcriptional regulator [Paenibacillus sp. SDF0028]TQR42209.1 AraC family transcriptional regulator [Paenibacillus sp. SDF0028]
MEINCKTSHLSPVTMTELLEQVHLPSAETGVNNIILPDTIGKGTVEKIRLRSGIEIHIWDFQCKDTDAVEIISPTHFVDLDFLIQGKLEYGVDGTAPHPIDHGSQLLVGKHVKKIGYMDGGQMIFLKIRVPSVTFKAYIVELLQNQVLQDGFSEDMLYRCSYQETIDPTILVILWQMMKCPYPKKIRDLYLETKVRELLLIYLYPITCFSTNCWSGKKSILRGDDAERICAAQQLLLQNLDNPPSLIELSRRVGLNDFKLKAGFKEVFDMTVFGYLREKRMQKAFYLLQQGGSNVSEVASAVGYSNPGYFAAVFEQKYGVKPSQMIKKQALLMESANALRC